MACSLVFILVSLSASLLPFLSAASPVFVVPPSAADPAPYPEWAHYHWAWLSHDWFGQDDMIQLVHDYQAHNISLGAIDIDSGWSTGYNNFVFNTTKFPNATAMVDTCHSLGVRVILWVTSMIDTDSPNFKEGYDKGYYVRGIDGVQATVKWWHGTGCFIDYTNPEALQWWHQQMDLALATGIDGWKCDGTDPFILKLVSPRGHAGIINPRDYANDFYNDFYDYTRSKLGNDRLIMSRPVDAYGPIYHEFSPRRVMTSGWVGDQDDTYEGLQQALKRYLQSAWANYANFGSDIGGYRTPQNRTIDLFLRWAQLGAFSPLMENGGNGEHRPWLLDTTTYTTDVYRVFVNIHYALIPYFLSIGSVALETNTSVLTPIAKHESFIDKLIDDFQPATYDFLLGKNILVAPVTSNSSDVKVTFPKDSWAYWFDTSLVIQGTGKPVSFTCPLHEFPAFHRVGSIIPLNITNSLAGYGDEFSSGFLTALVVQPRAGTQSTTVRQSPDSRGRGVGMDLEYTMESCVLTFRASAHAHLPLILLLDGVPYPTRVTSHTAEGTAELLDLKTSQAVSTAGRGFHYNGSRLAVRPGSNSMGTLVVVEGVCV